MVTRPLGPLALRHQTCLCITNSTTQNYVTTCWRCAACARLRQARYFYMSINVGVLLSYGFLSRNTNTLDPSSSMVNCAHGYIVGAPPASPGIRIQGFLTTLCSSGLPGLVPKDLGYATSYFLAATSMCVPRRNVASRFGRTKRRRCVWWCRAIFLDVRMYVANSAAMSHESMAGI